MGNETNGIVVRCSCGKALRARMELAGRTAKCPSCGTLLTVPIPPRQTPATQTPSQSFAPPFAQARPRTDDMQAPPMKVVFWVMGAVGLVIVGGIIFMAVRLSRPTEPNNQTPIASVQQPARETTGNNPAPSTNTPAPSQPAAPASPPAADSVSQPAPQTTPEPAPQGQNPPNASPPAVTPGTAPAPENQPVANGLQDCIPHEMTAEEASKFPSDPALANTYTIEAYDAETGKIDRLTETEEKAMRDVLSTLNLQLQKDREQMVREFVRILGYERARKHQITFYDKDGKAICVWPWPAKGGAAGNMVITKDKALTAKEVETILQGLNFYWDRWSIITSDKTNDKWAVLDIQNKETKARIALTFPTDRDIIAGAPVSCDYGIGVTNDESGRAAILNLTEKMSTQLRDACVDLLKEYDSTKKDISKKTEAYELSVDKKGITIRPLSAKLPFADIPH